MGGFGAAQAARGAFGAGAFGAAPAAGGALGAGAFGATGGGVWRRGGARGGCDGECRERAVGRGDCGEAQGRRRRAGSAPRRVRHTSRPSFRTNGTRRVHEASPHDFTFQPRYSNPAPSPPASYLIPPASLRRPLTHLNAGERALTRGTARAGAGGGAKPGGGAASVHVAAALPRGRGGGVRRASHGPARGDVRPASRAGESAPPLGSSRPCSALRSLHGSNSPRRARAAAASAEAASQRRPSAREVFAGVRAGACAGAGAAGLLLGRRVSERLHYCGRRGQRGGRQLEPPRDLLPRRGRARGTAGRRKRAGWRHWSAAHLASTPVEREYLPSASPQQRRSCEAMDILRRSARCAPRPAARSAACCRCR